MLLFEMMVDVTNCAQLKTPMEAKTADLFRCTGDF